jgi:hypothetical protein
MRFLTRRSGAALDSPDNRSCPRQRFRVADDPSPDVTRRACTGAGCRADGEHAFSNDQALTDAHDEDLRRARAAAQHRIRTETGRPLRSVW